MQNLTLQPPAAWVSFFMRELLIADANAEVVRALLNHLADLGLFEPQGNGLWKISGAAPTESRSSLEQEINRQLDSLCNKKEGFAVLYFLSPREGRPSPSPLTESNVPEKISSPEQETKITVALSGEKSSDPSNLQIVKKLGRQLQPFLAVEEKALAWLEGPNTSREDARMIFNFIFSRNQEKAEPRKWEQLSRKRHK